LVVFWWRLVDWGDLALLSHLLIMLESSSEMMSLELLISVEYDFVIFSHHLDGVFLVVLDEVTLEPYHSLLQFGWHVVEECVNSTHTIKKDLMECWIHFCDATNPS
jgi:hypothetical protein